MGEHAWMVMLAAVALDLLLGDPQGWPHPVRWMGKAIVWFEPLCRRLWRNEGRAGLAFAAALIGAAWWFSYALLKFMTWLHPVIGLAGSAVMLFYCLAIRSLLDAGLEIYNLLASGRIESARRKLAFIVSRDVGHYQEDDIARATVETVAENLVDGVLSPLFFAALGGVPLAMAYKMVNTLDAMVGYKNARYIRFGKAAARIDDIANIIPARLSVALIAAAARLLGGSTSGRRAWLTAWAEGHHHTSPNAGYPEAAFAGALSVRLNGPNYYHGQLVEKPFLGAAFGNVTASRLLTACHLMLAASLLGVSVFGAISKWTG